MKTCVIIPTYNNSRTVGDIVNRTLQVCDSVIVVNDGSTDDTLIKLRPYTDKIQLITYPCNRGKGHALRMGFRSAKVAGYDFAITIDSDGQHDPSDMVELISKAEEYESDNLLVVGCRDLCAEGMPARNTFANRLSNFWFFVQTGISLPDTQTGYRLYSLHHLPCIKWLSSRYESELELLVFSAWRGVKIVPVKVSVSYPPDRVSHFRPFSDFARIFILNTLLCFLSIIYGYPRMLMAKMLKITQ